MMEDLCSRLKTRTPKFTGQFVMVAALAALLPQVAVVTPDGIDLPFLFLLCNPHANEPSLGQPARPSRSSCCTRCRQTAQHGQQQHYLACMMPF